MGHVLAGLGKQSFLLLFLVVGLGYLAGRVKVKDVGLGATASTLIIGLGLSLAAASVYGVNYAIPEFASTLFFNMFMFAIGIRVGPQFMAGLRRDAKKFVALGLLIPLLSFGCMMALRALIDFPPGVATGLFAGANTATPGLGAAQAALAGGGAQVSQGAVDAAASMSTTFAIAYCVGMVGFILLLKLPDLMGRNTAAAAREFEALTKQGGAPLPGSGDEFFWRPIPVAVRAYKVENLEAVGRPLSELRRSYPRMAIERVRRGDKLIEPADGVVLQPHDTLALYGPIEGLIRAGQRLGPEVDDPQVQQMAYETVDVVARTPVLENATLASLAAGAGHGLYLNAMFRGGEQIPHGPDTVVHRGDVLRVTGSRWRLALLEKHVGKIVRESVTTDVVFLAVGLCLGALLGLVAIPIGSTKLALGSAIGLLIVGIALGTLRTRHPRLGGPFPEPARQLVEDLGLNVFIATVGINSGARVMQALGGGGLGLILIGSVLVGIVPPFIGWIVGRRLMRMNEAVLLGAVAGGRCNSAGLRTAQEVSHSLVPALSYPVTFAIANIVLTMMCYGLALMG